jgi:hypothetical protein
MSGAAGAPKTGFVSGDDPRHAGWMWLGDSRFSPHQYAVNAAGLAHASADLGHRERTRKSFAGQPDITPAWQKWVDRADRDAGEQGAVVHYLTMALDRSGSPKPENGAPDDSTP